MRNTLPQLAVHKGLRGDILLELKRSQPRTATELGATLGVSANAIRHHLKELVTESLITYCREQRGVGAPTYAYRLSPEGEAIFPKRYEETLTELLGRVAQKDGRGAVVELFADHYAALARKLAAELGDAPPAERLAAGAPPMSGPGYIAGGAPGHPNGNVPPAGGKRADPGAGRPELARDARGALGERAVWADRLPGDQLLRGAEEASAAGEPGASGPQAARDVREAGAAARGAEATRRRRGGRRVRQRLGGDDVPGDPRAAGDHFLCDLGGDPRAPGARAGVRWLGGALQRQLLRRPQLGRVHRRLVRLHPEGGALPARAVDLLPDQHLGHGPVRAHAHRGRGGELRELPRGLLGADP